MIVSVPSPPLLLPGRTGRPVDEVEQLRTACLDAIRELLADQPGEIVILGADRPVWSGGRPLSALVAETLLADAESAVPTRYLSVEADLAPADCQALGRTLTGESLLVVADGSARRGPKAPGYVDQRAAPFDQLILHALQHGDPAGLATLDATLATDLMVAGRAAWQVMAGAAEGRSWRTHTHYADDPFGVFYPVVTWR